jgi:plastocyanin domain-containing protein
VNSVDAVIVAVSLAIGAWQLWYFLGRRSYAAPGEQLKAGTQEFRIMLEGGFSPDLVVVEAGRRVRLEIFRSEVDPESEHLAFDNLKVTKTLAEFTYVPIEFIPSDPGDYRFYCGTCDGYVVAQVGGDAARSNLGRGHQKHG